MLEPKPAMKNVFWELNITKKSLGEIQTNKQKRNHKNRIHKNSEEVSKIIYAYLGYQKQDDNEAKKSNKRFKISKINERHKTTDPGNLDNTKQINSYFKKLCLVYSSLTQSKRNAKSPKRNSNDNQKNTPYSEKSQIRITACFSSEIMQARKDQNAFFECRTKHFPIWRIVKNYWNN